MARISGVDLPRNKRLDVALTYIFGIGRVLSTQICGKANIDAALRTDRLSEEDVAKLRDIIEHGYTVEGDLRREESMNINRLMDLGCYRGLRHRKGLPVNGQRTKTNARTRKGRKRVTSSRAVGR